MSRPGGEVGRVPPRPGGQPPGGYIPEQVGGDTPQSEFRALLRDECRPAPGDCVIVVSEPADAPGHWIVCAVEPGSRTLLAAVTGPITLTVRDGGCADDDDDGSKGPDAGAGGPGAGGPGAGGPGAPAAPGEAGDG
ncbi:hypothetical protein [Pseudonocardia sp. NPDC046786]|uniref:hypothetical protein n=1 Tax=Pseudonocardia sp. NPDC046786 TaxID=3155471 RepID=UPI003409F830